MPVGSSARITRGFDDEGARDRDALLLAAGELVRVVVEAVAEADALERARAARWCRSRVRTPRVEERQLDVLERRWCATAG